MCVLTPKKQTTTILLQASKRRKAPNMVAWPQYLVNNVFMTKADLETAVGEYEANPTNAIATYGAIAGWDVSRITDMSQLFSPT